MSDSNATVPPPPSSSSSDVDDGGYEEECVICLEPLSESSSWGRCTPCQHAFHQKCWWQWENAHNERVDQAQRRGEDIPDNNIRGPKCCLCNALNEQFVDGNGKPVHNPEPFVASEDHYYGVGDGRSFSIGSMSFNPENFTLENFQRAVMDMLPSDLTNDPNFVRQFSESVFSSNGNGVMGGAFQFPTDATTGFQPGVFLQRLFGGGGSGAATAASASSSTAAPFAAPNNAQQSNNYHVDVGLPFNEIRQGTPVVTQNLVSSQELNGRVGQIVRYDASIGRYLVRIQPSTRNQSSNVSSNSSSGDTPASSSSSSAAVTVAIKPENLLQMARVKVHGLQSQPHLNGIDGNILSYSLERDRYVVRVSYIDPEVLSSLPPEIRLEMSLMPPETRDISLSCNNIRIPVGTCVRLEGLESHAQWNGKYGRIVKWVSDANDGGNEEEADGGGGDGGWSGGRYEVRLSRQYAVLVKPKNVRL